MKIALAQINPTIGDFTGNTDLIVQTAKRARQLGADLCCFPEQSVPGYPAHDLVERRSFVEQNVRCIEHIAASVPDIGLIVGFAEPNNRTVGKRLYNSAALLFGGRVISTHRKTLLPTYDVFDESRYFDPSPDVQTTLFKDKTLGITICEDVWNDADFWSHRKYDRDPVTELVNKNASIIINIAASPFTLEKRTLRRNMLQAAALHYRRPLLFVNSIGGNDELVFDGASLAYGPDGKLLAQGYEFRDDLVMVDLKSGTGDIHQVLTSNEEAALEALILGTRDYARKCGFKSAILGLSGGIDSALVLYIGAQALGADNISGIMMPSRFSSPGSISDSEELAHNLGIKVSKFPIDELYQHYISDLKSFFGDLPIDTAEENIQARIRGNILMAFSNKFGHLVLSTGNKSEFATGYCTLYGDMAGGLAVLSDVPKTMVYNLCRFINRNCIIIPQSIIDKPPSAELKPDQRDADSLPPYDLLDTIIEQHIVNGMDGSALIESGYEPENVKRILSLIRHSEYKRRQAPPGLKLTSKSFGYGRRVPLAHRWHP